MSKESRLNSPPDDPPPRGYPARAPKGARAGPARRSTRMLAEAREAPAAVSRQLAHDDPAYSAFGALLREQSPTSMLTIARGSSDHAAHFMAYLIMARMGRLVTS